MKEDDTGLCSSSCNKEFIILKVISLPTSSVTKHATILICEIPPFCSLPWSSLPPLPPPTPGSGGGYILQTCVYTDMVIKRQNTTMICYRTPNVVLAHGNELFGHFGLIRVLFADINTSTLIKTI